MTTFVDMEQLKKMDKQNISDVGILNSTDKGEVVAQLVNFKHNGIFHMALAYDYIEAFGHHLLQAINQKG